MIDTVMIKKCGVNQDQWRVKDWESYFLVLRLHSAVTVGEILSVKGQQDKTTHISVCLVLLFMRVQLVDVNFKGNLQAKEHVTMLWSYFRFFFT